MAVVNRCTKCVLMTVTTCPLRDHAWEMFGLDGLEHCSMSDAIDRMLMSVKVGWKSLNGKKTCK